MEIRSTLTLSGSVVLDLVKTIEGLDSFQYVEKEMVR